MKKILVFSAIMIGLTLQTASAHAQTFWMEGVWNGSATQSNPNETWTVRLAVARHGDLDSYRVTYPTLGCSGYWTYVRADGEVTQFVEHIDHGADKCVDRVNITVGPSARGEFNRPIRMRYHAQWSSGFAGGELALEQ